jgi:lathosterol oxidase
MQSLPYHLYVFLFPLHKLTYLGLYVLVNVWSTSIHDGNFVLPGGTLVNSAINGAANHTIHHLMFNFNYGQYFTLWDRIGGSYLEPTDKLLGSFNVIPREKSKKV